MAAAETVNSSVAEAGMENSNSSTANRQYNAGGNPKSRNKHHFSNYGLNYHHPYHSYNSYCLEYPHFNGYGYGYGSSPGYADGSYHLFDLQYQYHHGFYYNGFSTVPPQYINPYPPIYHHKHPFSTTKQKPNSTHISSSSATPTHPASASPQQSEASTSQEPPTSHDSLSSDDRQESFHRIKHSTTLMIRNVPNRCTLQDLLKILDRHCAGNTSNNAAYDFVYLVMDFRTCLNKGYAFVNFTTPKAARVFRGAYHEFPWIGFRTTKVCEISIARIQGLDALRSHFEGSGMMCVRDDFLPIIFNPARNGLNFEQVHYQTLVQRSLQGPTAIPDSYQSHGVYKLLGKKSTSIGMPGPDCNDEES